MKTETLSKKIDKYASQFENKTVKREGEAEKTITILADKASEELKKSVMEAHGDRLPTDWIFDKYQNILESLQNYDIKTIDDIEEYRNEIVEGLVDVYTAGLTEWLDSSIYNVSYLTEALKVFEIKDGIILLSMAQSLAISEIMQKVIELIENN